MNGKTILVVDDESAHRMMLRAHLEKAGFEVHEAGSGREALDQVEAGLPDLMLLDLKMEEDTTGLMVIEKLRENNLARRPSS